MKSILDPTFKYTKSVETDLRKTFARVRKEMRAQVEADAAERAAAETEQAAKVRVLRSRGLT